MPELHIRKARPSDVPAMLELINNYARTGLMLPRTEFEMCENIRDFSVALAGKASGLSGGRGGPLSPPEQAGMPTPQGENIRDFSVALAGKASGLPHGRGGPVCPPEQAGTRPDGSGCPAPPDGRRLEEAIAPLTAEQLAPFQQFSPGAGATDGALDRARTCEPPLAHEVGTALAGCGALHFYTPQMAELRSLAVSERLKAAGVGRRIVAALLEEARDYGLDVVFAFTYVAPFFEKCGFRVVDRGTLPLKVWKDCVRCPHFNCCDETAMVHLLRPEARAAENGHDGLVHLSSHITRWPGAEDEAIQVPRVTTGGFQAR